MASCWTNKYAIMRDLSMVQGCVPGEIEGTVGVGEKPPALELVEDTEEEFYRKYTSGDDNLVLVPDFEPIRMFLDMVNEDSSPDKDIECQPERKFVVSKLNPSCSEFVPNNLPSGDSNKIAKNRTLAFKSPKPKTCVSETVGNDCKKDNSKFLNRENSDTKNGNAFGKLFTKAINDATKTNVTSNTSKDDNNVGIRETKPRKKRNVAIESIFQMESKENMSAKDVLVNDTTTSSVTEIITSPKKIAEVKTPKKVSPFLLNPSSMFKVKEGVKKEQVAPKQPNNPEKPVFIKKYVPSKQADEFYKKYVERSQIAKQAKEDIWARAERIMKDIDLKRKIEAEIKALEESVAANKKNEDTSSNTEVNDNSTDKSCNNSTGLANESSIGQANDNPTSLANENSISQANHNPTVNTNDYLADKTYETTTVDDANLETKKVNKNAQATENTNMVTDVCIDIPSSSSMNDDSTDSTNVFDSSVISDTSNDYVTSSESPPLHSSETSEGEVIDSPLPAREPYLTTHRHHFIVSSDCVVCQVLCKGNRAEKAKETKPVTETQILSWRVRE